MAKQARGGRNNQQSIADKGPERSGVYGPRKVKSQGMPTSKPKPGHVWARLRPGVWIQSNTNRPVSASNPKPRPNYAPKDGFKWVRKNGRWLQVRSGNAGKKAGGGSKKNRVNTIDPRDAQYRQDFAQLNMNRQNQLAAINRQLSEYKPLYDQGVSDLFNKYDQARYGSNADLASRGIFNSGERNKRAVDFQDTLGRGQLDLSNQYGEGAIRDLTGQQSQIQSQFNLDRNRLYADTKDRYKQRHPASKYIFNTLGNLKN